MVTFTKFMEGMFIAGNKQDKINVLMSVEDDVDISNLLYYALSPDIVFGIKSWDEPLAYSAVDNDIDIFLDLLKALSQNPSNSMGNKELITCILMQYTEETARVFAKVIRKNLGYGITVKLVNEAYPNHIPTFDICLCSRFEERHGGKQYFIEPKFDGVRLIIMYGECNNIHYFSRRGKSMFQLAGILDEDMRKIYKYVKCPFVLDGELVAESFDQTISLKAPSAINKDNLKYKVFDIIPYIEWVNRDCFLPLRDRRDTLIKVLRDKLETIELVPYYTSENMEDISKLYNYIVNIGFEGIVLKRPNSLYEYKRSQNWIKMKPVNTYTGIITEINRGTGKYIDCMGSVIVEGVEQGEPFKVRVGSGFTDSMREHIWHNQPNYMKLCIEVKAQSMTKDGSLRFPIFKRF